MLIDEAVVNCVSLALLIAAALAKISAGGFSDPQRNSMDLSPMTAAMAADKKPRREKEIYIVDLSSVSCR